MGSFKGYIRQFITLDSLPVTNRGTVVLRKQLFWGRDSVWDSMKKKLGTILWGKYHEDGLMCLARSSSSLRPRSSFIITNGNPISCLIHPHLHERGGNNTQCISCMRVAL